MLISSSNPLSVNDVKYLSYVVKRAGVAADLGEDKCYKKVGCLFMPDRRQKFLETRGLLLLILLWVATVTKPLTYEGALFRRNIPATKHIRSPTMLPNRAINSGIPLSGNHLHCGYGCKRIYGMCTLATFKARFLNFAVLRTTWQQWIK